MSFVFDRVWLLPLAVLLPAAVVGMLIAWHRSRRRRIETFGTRDVVMRLVPPSAGAGVWWRSLRLGTAAALVGIAFAGPRWGVERGVVRGEGIDLVLALDASLSMLAEDERPNRLERMRQEVRRLRAQSSGDRIALIAFAGRSYILTPLTIDNGALDLFLDNLDPSVVGQAGSSLARAIRQGTDLLLSTKATSDRALVVMSDGEAFEPVEDVTAAAQHAAENGIALVTVGFGTPQGSTIPVQADNGVEPKRDESGAVVVSHYEPNLLRAAAEAAHGTFVDASETDKASRVRAALRSLRAQQRTVETGQDLVPRFQLFLIPALLLFLLDTVLAERRGVRPHRAAAAAPAAAVVFLLFAPRVLHADEAGDAERAYREKRYAQSAALYGKIVAGGNRTPEAAYNYATALLAADSLQKAGDILERIAGVQDPELRYRTLFNLGLVHLRRGLATKGEEAGGELDAALALYRRALLMRPQEMDAKWNYELALRKKKEQSGGGGGGGGGAQQQPQPDPRSSESSQAPKPAGGLGERQAEQLLRSAAREEREVQGKKQKQNKAEPPPGGKDW